MKKLLYLFLYVLCCSISDKVNAQSSFSKNPNPPKEKTGEVPQTDAFCSSVVVLSQTQDNSIIVQNSINCNSGGLHTDNSYWRAFNLANLHPNTSIEVSTIQIGIEAANATSGTQPITVRLYYMVNSVFPSGTLSAPISTTTHTITNQALTLVNLPVSVLLQQNRELVVEIFTPDGRSVGNSFYIGSNNLPETAPTYISAPACTAPNPVTFASIGSANVHAVINVVGCVISCNNLTSILASPATVCTNGTTLLTATGIEPNATVSWYANATTNTVLGTGNTFTTPPLSTAATFFASQGISIPPNDTLDYTGAMQTITIPPNVNKIIVELYGASGADGAVGGNGAALGAGGLGSKITGELNVTTGQVLNVFVGGAGSGSTGGFNGGGTGGNQLAGGGGGATDIRIGGTLPANRALIAAGGGGGGRGGCFAGIETGGAGGAGNGDGTNGGNSDGSGGGGGGFGGIGINGGAAGIGCGGFLGQPGVNGNADGQGGNGGNGQTCCCPSIPGGGGGGGGYVGGGGGGGGSAGTTGCSGNGKGGGGGGAGGTNYLGFATNTLVSNGIHTGNGKVIIRYIPENNCTASTRIGKTVNVHPSTITYVSPTDNVSTNQGTKQASQSIHAKNTITATGEVTYKAANAIFLNQNFSANAGSVFKAEIGGCN